MGSRRRLKSLADVLDDYRALNAARAELLRRLGRHDEARAAFDRAIAPTSNDAELRCLRRDLDATHHS